MNKRHLFLRVLLIGFLLFLLTLNSIVELKGTISSNAWLYPRVALALSIIYIAFDLGLSKFRKWIRLLLLIWFILFVTNLLLNLINVYSLSEHQVINNFCRQYSSTCNFATRVFYISRLYRFITLSSYFFLFPILILLTLHLPLDFRKSFQVLSPSKKIFSSIVVLIIFSNLLTSFQVVYLSTIQSFQALDQEYYGRFVFKTGGVTYYGWIKLFADFIIDQTAPDSRILVPPQSVVYKAEGNINYFRWFLYPRKLYHLEDLNAELELQDVDYIVISAGECDNQQCVWPNFSINKEKIDKIILIERETQELSTQDNTSYSPEEYYRKWGAIKLK